MALTAARAKTRVAVGASEQRPKCTIGQLNEGEASLRIGHWDGLEANSSRTHINWKRVSVKGA